MTEFIDLQGFESDDGELLDGVVIERQGFQVGHLAGF
jgi:hypothetical protein